MSLATRFRNAALLPLLVVAGLALAAAPATSAVITIVNNDGVGEGFNDPTPRAQVGGNPGTTLGAQRLFIFQHAANIWGGILQSDVEIFVRAQFNPQTCTATSAVLGSAGPVHIIRDFAGADYPSTWYHVALANKLSGVDQTPAVTDPDINATFNLNLDSGACLGGATWYYGIDGNEGANVELLPVVLHELGHGLGFSTSTNGSTGAIYLGFPHIWDRFLMDNTNGLHWFEMTAAQRVASAISVDKLVWDGYWAGAAASTFLSHRPRMQVLSPAGIAGTYAANGAAFGAPLTLGGITGNVVLVDDGTGVTSDGCEPLVNGAALAGNIALIDRGTCTFVLKTAAAQAAGAIAVIIANNVAGPLTPGGADPSITIPVVGITQADGNTLKANLGSGVSVTLGLDPVLLAGADPAGRPMMYAPNPFQGGSSVSHYDVTMNPNALMEPAINVSLHDDVDLTTPLFRDIGWFPEATATTLAMFVAEGRGDGVMLRWRFTDPEDVVTVTVERAGAADGPWSSIPVELGSEGSSATALDAGAPAGQTAYYRLNYLDRAGDSHTLGLAAAMRPAALAAGVQFGAPRPNPTQDRTSVLFTLARPEFVRLTVTDAGGRRVRTLHEGMMLAGEHSMDWDGRSDHAAKVPAGVYFIHLTTSQGNHTQRVAMMH
jgi:hypothetical protein